MHNSTQRTTLYRYFDSEGQLLYVGITQNQLGRFAAHSKTQPWFEQVAYGTFTHYETRSMALEEESFVIGSEFPKYNKAGPVLEESAKRHLSSLISSDYSDDFHKQMSKDIADKMFQLNTFSKKPEAHKLLFAFCEAIPWDEEGEETLVPCSSCQEILDSKWYRQLMDDVHYSICEEFQP